MIPEGEIVDLAIEDLGFGAQGIGRISSFVILVAGAIPGDLVRVRIVNRKPNYARAEIIEFLAYSRNRMQARCRDHEECGGCQLMEMKYESQLHYKTKQLADILQRIGKQSHFIMREMIPSPEIFRYRNRMEYSFGFDSNGQQLIGLHLPGCHDRVKGLNACHLQSAVADKILRNCRAYFQHLKGRMQSEHNLRKRHLLIREGKTTEEVLVAMTVPQGEEEPLNDFALKLKREIPQVKTFVVRSLKWMEDKVRRTKDHILFGDGTIEERVGSLHFTIGCDTFFQANTSQAYRLMQIVHDLTVRRDLSTVLDLYCGSGSLSLFLSGIVRESLGIDLSYPSIRSAQLNAERNEISNCTYLCVTAEYGVKDLVDSKRKFDLVLANPSRTGMTPSVISGISLLAPKRIVYVSCNPSTLARDLKLLAESRYTLREVIPVDMFPHTYHLESVAYCERS